MAPTLYREEIQNDGQQKERRPEIRLALFACRQGAG
jgi:hypothetical protein